MAVFNLLGQIIQVLKGQTSKNKYLQGNSKEFKCISERIGRTERVKWDVMRTQIIDKISLS